MKKAIILFLLALIFNVNFSLAQSKSDNEYPTVFDETMLKITGLTMNQYYNKLYSVMYEQQNYRGQTDTFVFGTMPMVFINNRRISVITPDDLYFHFSKVNSVKTFFTTKELRKSKYFKKKMYDFVSNLSTYAEGAGGLIMIEADEIIL